MSKLTDIDAYISSLVLSAFKENMLFMLIDKSANEISYVFQNPFELVRLLWKETVPYFDDAYSNTLYYLYGISYELNYFLPHRYLKQLFENIEDVNETHLNNAALLFLLQSAVYNNSLSFGYVLLPEQKELLNLFIKTVSSNTTNITEHIIKTADDDIAKVLVY